MKKIIKPFLLTAIICSFMAISQISLADPPPPPSGGHGSGANQNPMNGPIAGGVIVFFAFAAGLTGWEVYKSWKRKKEEAPE